MVMAAILYATRWQQADILVIAQALSLNFVVTAMLKMWFRRPRLELHTAFPQQVFTNMTV